MANGTTPRLMRMRELSALTGISKSAIRFYVSEGLAPGPVQHQRNSALYSEDTLRGLELVRQLREDQGYSLAMIRQSLAAVGSGAALAEAGELKSALAALGGDAPAYGAEDLCARTGLKPAELKRAEKVGLVLPVAHGAGAARYDESDVAAAQAVVELLAMGATWKELESFGEAARRFLELQMALQQRLVQGLSRRGVLKVSSTLLRIGRINNRYLFDRNLKQAVMAQLEQTPKEETGND